MTKPLTAMFARAARPLALASLAVLAACTTLEPGSGAAGARVAARPEPAAQRVQGDLAELRRCMDNLLLEHGARDISVIVEDLADPGRRTTAISREMLAAAVSGMTQRSRAIRLVTSASVQPQYALRGSVGALDGAKPGTSAFGLDLTLLTTQDMSVVPGTATRNKVTLYGAGAEGRAEVGKFGVSFVVPAGGSDASSQALRALAEVSSVELFGRLARVPYWSCFGTTADDATIAAEVQDWYDTMAARPAEIVGYFQAQLRTRRVYDGPIDGAVTPPFKEAVARYREALGLSREAKLSLDFFRAYLAADHHKLEARLAAAPATAAPLASSAAADAPLALRIAGGDEAHRFAPGEAVQLSIRPNRDAHVYCYLQDENRRVVRFFPNRFQRDSRVKMSTALQLPGAMRFEIVLKPRGTPQTVACFATDRDVLALLPAGLNPGDFEALPVASLDQVRSAFVKVAGAALAQESLQIRPK